MGSAYPATVATKPGVFSLTLSHKMRNFSGPSQETVTTIFFILRHTTPLVLNREPSRDLQKKFCGEWGLGLGWAVCLPKGPAADGWGWAWRLPEVGGVGVGVLEVLDVLDGVDDVGLLEGLPKL